MSPTVKEVRSGSLRNNALSIPISMEIRTHYALTCRSHKQTTFDLSGAVGGISSCLLKGK